MAKPQERIEPPRRRSWLLVGLVSFCAAFVTGSCGAFANGSEASHDVLIFALLSAAIAWGVGALFASFSRDSRRVRVYAALGIASYAASELGAWWVFILPGCLALGVTVVGGLLAGYFANDEINAVGRKPRIVMALGILAVAVAAATVVFSFYRVSNVVHHQIDLLAFALVVGMIPPLVAAITAPVLTAICRRGAPTRIL